VSEETHLSLAPDATATADTDPDTDARAETTDVRRPTPTAKRALDASPPAVEAKGGVPSAPSPVGIPAAQQIVTAILQDLSAAEPQVAPRAASSISAPVAPQEPARLLRIALEPEQLGGVTVQLRQSVVGLHVVVAAERPETSALLERDRDLLCKVLEASGLKVEDVAIRHPATEAPAVVAQRTDTGVAQSAGQASPQLYGGAAGGERQQAQRSGRMPPRREDEKDEIAIVDDRGRLGALYV
jgi:hypothetical protein